jgi:hypothetical protein
MYPAISYGLGVFTLLMVLGLLWMGWQRRHDKARAERAKTVAALNSELGQSPQTVIGRSPR